MMKTQLLRLRGFTLIEILIVIAAVSALTSVGYVTATSVKDSAEQNKLTSDVASLNSAVQMYLASGGSLPNGATSQSVLAKLKTRSTMAANQGTVGLAGSFVDSRISPQFSSGSSKLKAFWDPTASRFYTRKSTDDGIVAFDLDEAAAAGGVTTEARAQTLVASDVSNGQPKWVWDYSDTTPAPWTGNSGVGAPSAPLAAYLSQQFQGGGLSVTSPDGSVDLGHLYRDAGYDSRLGLFSLEGMGADVYDLSTEAGAKAFLEEAIRRVLSDSTDGRIVADASQGDSVGSNGQFQFTAGDMLAAILIPNGTFEDALAGLIDGSITSGSNLYPLLSLSLPTDRAPFFESQMAYLGNGVYAIEDITGLSSDQDYNDFLFKTADLDQLPDSSVKTIDPTTYYLDYQYWDSPGPNGKSLKETLVAAGVIFINPSTGEITAAGS